MRVAVASEDGSVAGGHFAHAPRFRIYEVAGGRWRLIEERVNPLGEIPDVDAMSEHEIAHYHGMHGPQKYAYLRSEVLPDVDVVVAGGACTMSVMYFLEEGVKIVFAEPGTPGEEVLKALASSERLPDLGYFDDGRIVDLEEEG
jgi:predicted Fe-Mo cluster-binding NifX family protein